MGDSAKAAENFKEAVTRLGQSDKESKALEPRVKALAARLAGAIKERDQPTIQLQNKALGLEVAKIEKALDNVETALGYLAEAEKDDAFVEQNEARLETASKALSRIRDALTSLFKTAKQQRDQADIADFQIGKSEAAALRELAALDKNFKGRIEAIDAAVATVEDYLAKAEAAARAGDRAGFSSSFGLALSLYNTNVGREKGTPGRAEDDLAGFLKRFSTLLGSGGPPVLYSAEKTLRGHIAAMRQRLEQIDKRVNGFGKLAPQAIDIAKAAKVLKLEKQKPRLEKALDGPENGFERALETLARDLRLDTSGKDMLQELRKAKVL